MSSSLNPESIRNWRTMLREALICSCKDAKSFAATLKRIGQIARSAGTSRSDRPFTVTNRSLLLEDFNALPKIQAATARPSAMNKPRTTAAMGRELFGDIESGSVGRITESIVALAGLEVQLPRKQ